MNRIITYENKKIEYLDKDAFKFINNNANLNQKTNYAKMLIKGKLYEFSIASFKEINTFEDVNKIGFKQIYEFNDLKNLKIELRTYINKKTKDFEFTIEKISEDKFSFDEYIA